MLLESMKDSNSAVVELENIELGLQLTGPRFAVHSDLLREADPQLRLSQHLRWCGQWHIDQPL